MQRRRRAGWCASLVKRWLFRRPGHGNRIDGSRACDAFGSGKPSAFRGTMWLNSAIMGAGGEDLLASIKDGTKLPVQSFTDRNTSPPTILRRTTKPSSATEPAMRHAPPRAHDAFKPAVRWRSALPNTDRFSGVSFDAIGILLARQGIERFGVVQALDNVSIAFRPGEVLPGRREWGGKSTMMRIPEGVFGPDTGTVMHGSTPIVSANRATATEPEYASSIRSRKSFRT